MVRYYQLDTDHAGNFFDVWLSADRTSEGATLTYIASELRETEPRW
jgi:hypothetical protein